VVARNQRLRTRFCQLAAGNNLPAYVPSPRLCTDNAGMVGALAWKKYIRGEAIGLDLELDAYPR